MWKLTQCTLTYLNLSHQIDDSEFDIPELEKTPTLDSILHEPDDHYEFDTETFTALNTKHGDLGFDESSTNDSKDIRTRNQKTKSNVHYEAHGSVLRHVMLRGMSSQVVSAADRVDAGKPTSMAVSKFISIGTSHGLILVFDPKQVLKWCLGSKAVGAQYGAVTALSINMDCSRLLAGFAKGQMTMWDLTTGKLLRTITDAHPAGSAVLHIKFTDDPTLAICSDSGGSVFELSFKCCFAACTFFIFLSPYSLHTSSSKLL
ncbi:vacuolar protein sorting-associated protein 8 homolog [Anneissia japonica]|uniref:vacuolar protein sorting-associated protein 8 homolog n=1 Tax=Anneissia japonica TaxID=1529436 RepID=UPI001425968D|nr:vacuolar protein sorting-associated protein 8 homolog [Anneissia japonica]